ncbi:MAG: hypothetical protein K2X86_00020 [Cytophagaceae bacterium]|nr:hypothetical protein [Cytophagaceae bacterium]
MRFRLFVSLFFIALINLHCSSDKDPVSNQEKKRIQSSARNIEYEIVSEKGANGIKITNIRFDTASLHNETKGILVTFTIEASGKAFDSIGLQGFNSYFIDLTCTPQAGKSYCHRNEVFKAADKKKFLHINRDCFISQPTSRTLEVSFPYRLMDMSQGDHEMMVDINAYPAKFQNDSTDLGIKMLDNISPNAQTSISVKIKVRAPKLFKATVTVHSLKLNTKAVKPEKYDFAMGGSGYPDLFWEVYCGNDYIYYSPVIKNKIEYPNKYSSPVFYCTQDDIINLAVVDYDNGPFNTQDDIIEKWTIRASNLKPNKIDTLHFGNLEYMVVETTLE